jgi:hypothetical protein
MPGFLNRTGPIKIQNRGSSHKPVVEDDLIMIPMEDEFPASQSNVKRQQLRRNNADNKNMMLFN